MYYHKEVTISKDTLIYPGYETRIEIGKGIITRLRVFFPWGCANLCGVQIYRYEQQLLPLNRTEYLKGNDVEYILDSDIVIDQEPYELLIKGYNLDDIFEHKPVISVQMTKNVLTRNLEKFLQSLG